MIGIDQMSGYFRFAYGIAELGDGIGVVPVAVGLFGLAEILLTAGQENPPEVIRPRLRDLLPSRQEWREANMPIWRGTVIGFFIGIIPGSAHVISTFVSYAVERKISKHPEAFGQGAVAGVAGPESANNAATSGAFVPMLALGVPGVPVAALLLAAMMVHGVTPGPLLIQNDPRLFWGFIASMYVGNVILLILNLPLVGLFVNLLRVPYPFLYPVILVCSILGVYAVNSSAVDVWIMLLTGVLGYVLRKLEFETAPIVLGLVLAPMMELSLRQALAMSAGRYSIFVTRPISVTLLAVGAVLVAFALRPLVSRTLDWRSRLPAESEG
jgi:putative tricarboxylic transport membrane protein